MKFVVFGAAAGVDTLSAGITDIEWAAVTGTAAFATEENADAYFLLNEDMIPGADLSEIKVPVFINSVSLPLTELKLPRNVIRINAWPGFLEKPMWEVAGEITPAVQNIFMRLNKKFISVNDEPGFVSARILAMIINEAFFAKGENVSSEEEIDTAMKLGTNYPEGPFEWGAKIGLTKIHSLLQKLSEKDKRYHPAPFLSAAVNQPA